MAAQIFDVIGDAIPKALQTCITQDLKRIARWDWGKASLHRILDYLASKS
jgi:hypothetical protein